MSSSTVRRRSNFGIAKVTVSEHMRLLRGKHPICVPGRNFSALASSLPLESETCALSSVEHGNIISAQWNKIILTGRKVTSSWRRPIDSNCSLATKIYRRTQRRGTDVRLGVTANSDRMLVPTRHGRSFDPHSRL